MQEYILKLYHDIIIYELIISVYFLLSFIEGWQ